MTFILILCHFYGFLIFSFPPAMLVVKLFLCLHYYYPYYCMLSFVADLFLYYSINCLKNVFKLFY